MARIRNNAAATVFVAGLFLAWQRTCFTSGAFGREFTGCFNANGWSIVGSTAAPLAIALAIVAVAPRFLHVSPFELALGLGLLAATLGLDLETGQEPDYRVEWGYGPIVSFCAAGVLIALVLARLHPYRLERSRLRGLVPLAACVVYIVSIVLPLWGFGPRYVVAFFSLSWLTIAGLLLAIRLLYRWVRMISGVVGRDVELFILPLALVALNVIEVSRSWSVERGMHHAMRSAWAGIALGLALVLVVFGRAVQEGGLRSVRIPEILRIDRI